mmetsp:Transcript_134480/g.335460  ORF Transcript_134480/g.335460 Transcript_134480/m.335460 type:complete len:641 (-) Transcript_134480:205-2127(-)
MRRRLQDVIFSSTPDNRKLSDAELDEIDSRAISYPEGTGIGASNELPPLCPGDSRPSRPRPRLISARQQAGDTQGPSTVPAPSTASLIAKMKSCRATPPPPQGEGTCAGGNSRSPREAWRDEVQDIVAAADSRWYVVRARDGDDEGSCAGSSKGWNFPEGTTAVILPVDVRHIQPALGFLSEVGCDPSSPCSSGSRADADGERNIPCIVAVLIAPAGMPDEDIIILEAQQQLLDNGVEEVLWKCGSRWELRLSIAMGIARVQATCRAKGIAEERFRKRIAQFSQDLRRELERMTREAEEPVTGMFWQIVHKSFKGFPAMKTNLVPMPSPGVHLGHLRLEQILGNGTSGVVYAATCTESNQREAVKAIEKSSLPDIDAVSELWREMSCLRGLQHENIVSLLGALHGPFHVYLRMEFAGNTSLYVALKKAGGAFSKRSTHRCQAQLVSAICYCNGRSIAHRDLKPENIGILEDLHVKVLDFGSAMQADKYCDEIVGTMPFMAPEVLEASQQRVYLAAPVDAWSLGVILLEMLCGIGKMDKLLGWNRKLSPSPRRAEEVRNFFRDRGALAKAMQQDLGPFEDDLHALVVGTLQTEPRRRWTAAEAKRCYWLRMPPPSEERAHSEQLHSELICTAASSAGRQST